MIIAFCLAIVCIPLWAFSPTLALLTAGAFFIQFMVQGAWGVIPAHITELSPDSVRGFLPGFSYQCGVLFAGTISYIQAAYAAGHTYSQAMAMTMGTVFVCAVAVIALGKEKRGVEFGGFRQNSAPGQSM
jgi:MFS transporter, SHS family, lactate transporter